MKQQFRSGLIIAASIFALLGCRAKNTFIQPPPPEVTVAKPDRRDVTVFITTPGRIQARDSVEIRARVSGFLDSVDFSDGQMAEEG